MRIESFQPQHMVDLIPRINTTQAIDTDKWTAEFCQQLGSLCTMYTALTDKGVPVAVCGAMKLWEGRHHLFAYMSLDSGPYMVGITRGVMRFLHTLRGRVEAQISDGFGAGARWVELLGLKCETPKGMDSFFPDGQRGFMYAKVFE